MRTVFEPEGDLRGIDLLACLVALWRAGESGSLQFSKPGATAGFEIAGGELVASSSSDPRFETAAILVRAGKLDARTLERLAASEGSDRALLALQAGVLTRREWRWGEKIRAVEILSELLGWLEGEYFFLRTAGDQREAPEPRLPIPRLILELFLRSRDRSLVLKYLGGADVPLARASNFDAEFATFGLTADAESVVRLIDGTASAEEIASEAPAEAFAVEKLLAALVTLGLVHPEFAAGTAPGAEPPPAVGAEEREGPAAGEEEVEAEEAAIVESEEGDLEAEEEEEEPAEEEPAAAAGEGESGPTELGEPLREEEVTEAEPMTDAPLAGGLLEPDLESASFESAPAAPTAPSFDALDARGAVEPPSFDRPLDTTTGIGDVERPGPRRASALLWVLVLLAAAVGGVLWMRGRSVSSRAAEPQPPGAAAPTEVAAAAAAPTVAETAPAPSPVPATPTAEAAAAPTAAPTRSRPTPRTPAGKRAPAPAPAPAAEARDAGPQRWADRAARDAQRLASDKKTHYAIQLELVCEVPSLAEAFQHDRPAGSMWLLATNFQGRGCYKVLWGRYASIEAAKRALPGAPRFFSTPRNHPAVVGVR